MTTKIFQQRKFLNLRYTTSSSNASQLSINTCAAEYTTSKGVVQRVVVIVDFTHTIMRNGGGEVYVRLMHLSNVGPPSLPGKGDGKTLLSDILIQCQNE